MHFTTAFVGLLAAASSALAAPVEAEAVSARAAPPAWIIQSFKRSCNSADTECSVSFSVNTQLSAPTSCSYGVKGAQASRKSVDNVSCGPYTISSGWNGSFGEGRGFTTWAVVDHGKRLVTWPSYADTELVNGVVVTPNKSYVPSSF